MEKIYLINNEQNSISKVINKDDTIEFELEGKTFRYHVDDSRKSLSYQGKNIKGTCYPQGNILYGDMSFKVEKENKRNRSKNSNIEEGSMVSPMPGKIFKIFVDIGQKVKKGDTLLILEAMKMEHAVKASQDGIVKKIEFEVGTLVDGGVILASIEPINKNKLEK